jgi:hypothetical protein
MDLEKIEKAETSLEYWKSESLLWWRMYLRNVMVIKNLREQNRQLRRLLSDYTK